MIKWFVKKYMSEVILNIVIEQSRLAIKHAKTIGYNRGLEVGKRLHLSDVIRYEVKAHTDHLKSEAFIDSVVERIRNKQL